jgi:hypothetical protein
MLGCQHFPLEGRSLRYGPCTRDAWNSSGTKHLKSELTMWGSIGEIVLNRHQLSAPFYFLAGIIIGGIVSTMYAIKAQSPRLIIVGTGAGGRRDERHWTVSISNRPSFFGYKLQGEDAHDVHAHIKPRSRRPHSYLAYWQGPTREQRATIEPGNQRSLDLFCWKRGQIGYVVVDHADVPIVRFESQQEAFDLELVDRLGRRTRFPFIVYFDDSHLTNVPELRIIRSFSLRKRFERIRRGFSQMLTAFRHRED